MALYLGISGGVVGIFGYIGESPLRSILYEYNELKRVESPEASKKYEEAINYVVSYPEWFMKFTSLKIIGSGVFIGSISWFAWNSDMRKKLWKFAQWTLGKLKQLWESGKVTEFIETTNNMVRQGENIVPSQPAGNVAAEVTNWLPQLFGDDSWKALATGALGLMSTAFNYGAIFLAFITGALRQILENELQVTYVALKGIYFAVARRISTKEIAHYHSQ